MRTPRPSGIRCAVFVGAVLAAAIRFASALSAIARAANRAPTITFYFGLERPEKRAEGAFFAVGQPGSASYRRFMSVRQISNRFGATPATKRAFLHGVARLGLQARVDPSGVFARVSGSRRKLEHAFRVRITSEFFNFPNAQAYFLPGKRTLHLPAVLRPLVQDVVANYNRSQAAPPGEGSAGSASPAPPRNRGRWTRGCRAARSTGAYSYSQVRNAYAIPKLGSGAGASVAILNVGEDSPSGDIGTNARCFGYPRLRVRTLRTDGQKVAFGRGTFEPEEDLALVRGMAPRLQSLTFTKVWLAPPLWFLGAAQVLAARPLSDTFTMSYGECERAIRGRGANPADRAGADLMDSILVRLGLAGVGSFASAGDFGSTCNGAPHPGVAWPASSPYLTAVGGTRLVLNRANQRTQEVVWNDLRWMPAGQGGGAGGGGFSAFSAKPPYQQALPGNRRSVPDISANASNFPGWPVVLSGHWEVDAGTSSTAPLVASAFAIIDADQRAHHRPALGPVNGLLYTRRPAAPQTIYDIVSGDNRYDRRVPGHRARRGYDLASGLGVPQFANLIGALVAPAR